MVTSREQLLIKDKEIEDFEVKHRNELKVYKQKSKHLVYEYQHNLGQVKINSQNESNERALEVTSDVAELKKLVRSLKVELKEVELSHQEVVKSLRIDHERELSTLRVDFDRRAKELYNKYSVKTSAIRDDLELRRKSEYMQLEERKSLQINSILKSHEKSFSEIKNYYNDITVNNLALINSLKEQVEESKKREERSERSLNEVQSENRKIKEPLEAALAQGDILRRQLKNYDNDKMALKNTGARLKASEDNCKQVQWENEILKQRFQEIEKERDALYKEFSNKCIEVQQRGQLKTALLDKKLALIHGELESRTVALGDIATQLKQKDTLPNIEGIDLMYDRADKILAQKDLLTDKLRMDLEKVTRKYNDATSIRTI